MSQREAEFQTHSVVNQVPELQGYDAWATDRALQEALARHAQQADVAVAMRYGVLSGGALNELGFEANRHKPVLRSHDLRGRRIDRVEFHPAYHQLLRTALEHGVHAHGWRERSPGAQVVRAALSYLHHQAEAGTSCPLTMTFAAVPVLHKGGDAVRAWLAPATALAYDGTDRPADAKPGVTLGMGMTEKQGGSDVRANTTTAHALGGDEYELVGHKWFFSAPMSDGFLVLAQAPAGLSCFLLPRWRPDGSRNALRVMRLKDKLGNWSNASSEVEFQGAFAWRVGEEGRGVATILEMVGLTRLDCMLGSAAEMRRALIEALHHATHRKAFGRRLIEQPLMAEVLVDLALESEAATALAFRIAAAVDAAQRDPAEAALARIGTALGKFWICKRTPGFVNEAQECLGGAGYVEESILPRLFRESPLNSIWEGCGNIQCLDILRALGREAGVREALMTEIERARGSHVFLDQHVERVRSWLDAACDEPVVWEPGARRLAESLVVALQASLLLRFAPPDVGSVFVEARLGGGSRVYGGLPSSGDRRALLQRAWPVLQS